MLLRTVKLALALWWLGGGAVAMTDALSHDTARPEKARVAAPGSCRYMTVAQRDELLARRNLIRVALALKAQQIELGTPDGADLFDAVSGRKVALLSARGTWRASCQLGAIALSALDRMSQAKLLNGPYLPAAYLPATPSWPQGLPQLSLPFKTKPVNELATRPGCLGYMLVPKTADGLFALNGNLYRGVLYLAIPPDSPSTITAINILSCEDYLFSVVPSEMPSTWPLEALKAQAIAARSYACANLGKNEAFGYDVKATVEDQVYKGVSAETEAANLAVALSSGLVLKHQGKAVPAFFHAASGGATDLPENIWGRPLPYLKAVADHDSFSPHSLWSVKVDVDSIERALRSGHNEIGQLLSLFIVSRTASRRCQTVLATGSTGCALLSGEDFRRLLALKSTMFNIGQIDSGYIFVGRGFGHGLGLSQWGARALAERGCQAKQILKYYFKDVNVDYF